MQSIQNPYNLLKRDYEIGLAELSCRSQIGLLAYSPLAMGVLSGKYLDGQMPEGSRMKLFGKNFPRYMSPRAQSETAKYVALAKEFGLDASMMANSFVNDQPFVTSNIIGATTLEQLKIAIQSESLTLPKECLQAIQQLHHANPVGY